MKLKTIGLAILTITGLQASTNLVTHAATKHPKSVKSVTFTIKNQKTKTTQAKTHIDTKPNNSQLSNSWETDASKLNPIMEWETDNHGNPLIAQTYGPNHNIVYYRINTNNIGSYLELTKQAIAAWNSLGVLSLQPAPNDSVKAINISYNTNPNADEKEHADGVTNFDYDHNINQNPNIFTKNDISIEPNNDKNLDSQKLDTIEHEIGHALGFDHDKSQYFNPNMPNSTAYTSSVMATFADTKPGTYQLGEVPLGQREANNLRMHYNLK